jgi:FtsH-binding integral membrane protein
MIFDSFIKEGEKKGKESQEYKTAHDKYMNLFKLDKQKEAHILSPNQYLNKMRTLKALKLVVSAVLTGVAVSLSTITLD